MKKTILLAAVMLTGLIYGNTAMLFDFENGKTAVKKIWNQEHVEARVTGGWASSGQKSLRIKGAAYDSKTMAVEYFPGVSFRLPLRDWSKYRYLQFDLKQEQDDTPLSLLIQYGPTRRERISGGWQLKKGVYRIKINLAEMIGEPVLERLSNIREFEFHSTRAPHDYIIHVDNIQLIEGSPDEPLVYDSVMVLDAKNQPRPITPAPQIDPNAGLDRLKEVIQKEFPGRNFGLKAASVSEAVPFRNLIISPDWSSRVEFCMAQNEQRSVQPVLFRLPGGGKKSFKVDCRLEGIKCRVERIGYLDLRPTYRLELQGLVPGWYPDPIHH